MAQITAKVSFDPEKDSATVTLVPIGASEMEHELLTQFFQPGSVSLVPFHEGDQLESRFVIVKSGAFKDAQRACENRIRVRDGRPTIEQEEARIAAKAKWDADRAEANKAAIAAGYASADAMELAQQQNAARASLASAVADELEKRSKAKN